jgi:hypothetical protein
MAPWFRTTVPTASHEFAKRKSFLRKRGDLRKNDRSFHGCHKQLITPNSKKRLLKLRIFISQADIKKINCNNEQYGYP